MLLTYENEAILARQKGERVFTVIPKATLLIENPAAVISTSRNKAAAQAFVRFLTTPTAQTIFAETGYRPVLASRREAIRAAVPVPAAALQDRLRRRLGEGDEAVLRPADRRDGEDRAGLGVGVGA